MQTLSAPNLASEVREGTLKFLWRQWQTVGAMVTPSGIANSIVDPEVLILTSLWFLEHERRLADVAASWVRINSSLVSIRRLTNLSKNFPGIVGERLSDLALVGLEEAGDVRWKSLGASQGKLGTRDRKARAIVPQLSSWATLMLQLRRGMGVSAKADVLTFLLGIGSNQPEWASVSAIADSTCYTPTAIRRVADELAAARFIRIPGNTEGDFGLQRMYSADRAAWVNVLGTGAHYPGWGYWRERFLFVIDLLTLLDRLSQHDATAYASDVEARELLTRHNAALRRDRVVDPTEFAGADLDMAYLEKASRALINWMANRA